MAEKSSQEQMVRIIAATELSLVLLGFMHYYLLQLPQQKRRIATKKEPQ